jgi:hypothetical protein
MIISFGKLLVLIWLKNSALASETQMKSAEKYEQEFAHTYQGCQENSFCTPEFGQYYQKWREAFKNSFVKKTPHSAAKPHLSLQEIYRQYGWPFEFMAFSSWSEISPFMSLQSSCPHHNLKNSSYHTIDLSLKGNQKALQQSSGLKTPELKPILKASGFVRKISTQKVEFQFPDKNFSFDDLEKKYALNKIEIWPLLNDKTQSRPEIFWIPLEETTFTYNNHQLEILSEQEDQFFKLKIKANQEWEFSSLEINEIHKMKTQWESLQKTTCPEPLPSTSLFFPLQECFVLNTDEKKFLIKKNSGCF